jgi:excisionase family DNA binding protein
MDDRLLSADEVASFLGVKRDTVYKLITRSGLPGRKVGRLWKFRRQEVDDWVNAQPRKKAGGTTRRTNPRKGG